jgi:hypothetical protein
MREQRSGHRALGLKPDQHRAPAPTGTPLWYTTVAMTVVLALLVMPVGARVTMAALDLRVLGLAVHAFPAGAFITRDRVDTTAAAVNAEGFVGTPTTQGNFYRRLHFSGALFESARLPRFHGTAREVWLLATLFPSAAVARRALNADATFDRCDVSPRLPIPARTAACAYVNRRGPESGLYVLSTVGRVEYIVVGFVHNASHAARARAIQDASFVALHEAFHLHHLLALGRLHTRSGQ